MDQLSEWRETIFPLLTEYGLQVIGAVIILIAGWIVSNWLSNRVNKFSQRSEKIDNTLGPIFVKSTRILMLILTFLIVLGQFGVETASIIAVLGTIGLAIGLAIQGTLSNIAAGMMMLILRPIEVGDSVDIGGTQGIVREIGLFVTEMDTFDNIFISMPNSKIWGNKIENYTRNPTRRVDLEIGIHYDDNIDLAMKLIREILQSDERVLPEPEPLVAVGSLADSAVVIRVRPWTQTENTWPLRYDLLKNIKERFDVEGITIPFPQRDVHIHQNPEA